MKRLTERSKHDGDAFYPYCLRVDTCGGDGGRCGECEFADEVCERLAKYEDTGLTPKQIKKLIEKREKR